MACSIAQLCSQHLKRVAASCIPQLRLNHTLIAAPLAHCIVLSCPSSHTSLPDRWTVRVLDLHLGLVVFPHLDLGSNLTSAFNVFVLAVLRLDLQLRASDTFWGPFSFGLLVASGSSLGSWLDILVAWASRLTLVRPELSAEQHCLSQCLTWREDFHELATASSSGSHMWPSQPHRTSATMFTG